MLNLPKYSELRVEADIIQYIPLSMLSTNMLRMADAVDFDLPLKSTLSDSRQTVTGRKVASINSNRDIGG